MLNYYVIVAAFLKFLTMFGNVIKVVLSILDSKIVKCRIFSAFTPKENFASRVITKILSTALCRCGVLF